MDKNKSLSSNIKPSSANTKAPVKRATGALWDKGKEMKIVSKVTKVGNAGKKVTGKEVMERLKKWSKK